MKQAVKYIVDENGNKKEAVVPIRLWRKLQMRRAKKSIASTLSDLEKYFGKIKLTIDPLDYQKSVRNEWI